MRNFCWQRWAFVFLLVTRLVMGEMAHAMPAASLAAAEATAATAGSDPDACHDSEAAAGEAPAAHHAGDGAAGGGDHSNHSSGEQDCCETGECECPCLHVPCAALGAPMLNAHATVSLRASRGMDGVISQRPSGLFRPPA